MLNPETKSQPLRGSECAVDARRCLLGPKFFRSAYDRDSIGTGQREERPAVSRGLVSRARSPKIIARISDPETGITAAVWDWPSGILWNGWDGQQNEYPSMTDERDCYLDRVCVFPGVVSPDRIPEFRSNASVPRYESNDKSRGTARDFCTDTERFEELASCRNHWHTSNTLTSRHISSDGAFLALERCCALLLFFENNAHGK